MKSLTKLIYLIAVFCLILSLAACKSEHICEWSEWEAVDGEAADCTNGGKETRYCLTDPTHTETREVEALGHSFPDGADIGKCERCDYETNDHALTNKKVIIIGNSHTYFGGMVKEIAQSKKELYFRDDDRGYFYNLATSGGALNLKVTNWTFGNHSLKDLFSGDCQANRSCGNGTDHFARLTDNNYDYVIFQNGSTHGGEIMYWIDVMMNFFKEGNPDTKFIMLVQARAHNDHAKDSEKYSWLADLDEIEEKGVTIVDWGALVYDLYSGKTSLPGENTLPLNKNSFVIAKTESDGYHPNLLAGYITTLMAYCAITGESCVGQDYSFCSTTRSFLGFRENYYRVGESNFIDVFESEETMLAIQKLADQYYAEKAYRDYE